VREDVIEKRPEAVQVLVDGIARSGLWLDNPPRRRARREHAADFVGRFYFRQDPRLLKWALTNPLDRVEYQPLTPLRSDFELIVSLMRETGVLDRDIAFEEYIDPRFAEGAKEQTEWRYEPGDATWRDLCEALARVCGDTTAYDLLRSVEIHTRTLSGRR
jgi:NitT/TauT family transport system substrate-binding protein